MEVLAVVACVISVDGDVGVVGNEQTLTALPTTPLIIITHRRVILTSRSVTSLIKVTFVLVDDDALLDLHQLLIS